MTAKKWIIAFGLTVLGLFAALCVFNFVVDPFGIFGDRFLDWYEYDMTQNPRAAKIAYLDEHYQAYDSYIIGCSSTSSYPVETLNKYYGANFYNMIMYGADMLDVENESRYIIDHYICKNLIVNVYIDNSLVYDDESDPLQYSVHAKADGSDLTQYYFRYLLAKPTYAIDKLISAKNDTYLKQSFDAFFAETGAYDKKARDAEGVSDIPSYLAAYPVFADYPQTIQIMSKISETAQSLARIKQMCEEAGVQLTVVCAPVYWEYFDDFSQEDVLAFYTALADVTDFWDFSMSSVSYEMRYFYDSTHFRNCVGDMAIARMFGDTRVYIPEDFGHLVTKENVQQTVSQLYACSGLEETENTANVPVLLYHHLDPNADGSNDMAVSPEAFERQIRALYEAGYTAVSIDALQAYVNTGAALPDKPILITFDDGYMSNYEYAFPILQKYNMKATIFAIGTSVGHMEFYKDTTYPLTPHFGAAEIEEMTASGLISIQSHTYDMHQAADYETGVVRPSIQQLPGEDEADYIQTLIEDIRQEKELLEPMTGRPVNAIAYPKGEYSELNCTVLTQHGIEVTFTTQPGTNTIIKGFPQSLINLRRNYVFENTTAECLMDLVSSARG